MITKAFTYGMVAGLIAFILYPYIRQDGVTVLLYCGVPILCAIMALTLRDTKAIDAAVIVGDFCVIVVFHWLVDFALGGLK